MFQTLTTRQDGRARGVRRQVDAWKHPPPAWENPWNALWAMLVGFFMILVDATIVAVANPSIMDKLGASYDAVIWVTSAYLLAYAVPLLVAGRLGDRYGPKNLYLVGLMIFTAASLGGGLWGGGCLGRGGRSRGAGGPARRRWAGRQPRLAVDLLHQRAGRHHRYRVGHLAGSCAADAAATRRRCRRAVVWRRN